MSLLNRTPINPQPLSEAERAAKRLRHAPAQLFQTVLSLWGGGVQLLWNSENPQAILDDLGLDAKELFELSSKTAIFLESLQPGCTADKVALIRAHTVHEDGTVTVD
jgi:hypothetical protein